MMWEPVALVLPLRTEGGAPVVVDEQACQAQQARHVGPRYGIPVARHVHRGVTTETPPATSQMPAPQRAAVVVVTRRTNTTGSAFAIMAFMKNATNTKFF
jgi:hypothetical protein